VAGRSGQAEAQNVLGRGEAVVILGSELRDGDVFKLCYNHRGVQFCQFWKKRGRPVQVLRFGEDGRPQARIPDDGNTRYFMEHELKRYKVRVIGYYMPRHKGDPVHYF